MADYNDWVPVLPESTDGTDGLLPIVQGGITKRVKAGAAGGPPILDANGKIINRLAYEGVAGGVPTLDSNVKVEQRLAYEGVAGGVCLLDADGMPITSAGVKTLERGGDASNGYWLRLLHDIVIQWITMDASDASGSSGQYGDEYYFGFWSWTYPIEYDAVPAVSASIIRPSGASTVWASNSGSTTATGTSSWAAIGAFSSGLYQSGIMLTAIGIAT